MGRYTRRGENVSLDQKTDLTKTGYEISIDITEIFDIKVCEYFLIVSIFPLSRITAKSVLYTLKITCDNFFIEIF